MTEYANYGYGAVPALPVPARQRPPLPKSRHDIDREAREAEADRESEIRARAAQLEAAANGPVHVEMPTGRRLWIGGESLVQALANGAVPVSDLAFQR